MPSYYRNMTCQNCKGKHIQRDCQWRRCIFCWNFIEGEIHSCDRSWTQRLYSSHGEYRRAVKSVVNVHGFYSHAVEDFVLSAQNRSRMVNNPPTIGEHSGFPLVPEGIESEIVPLNDNNETTEDDAAKVGRNGVAENDVFPLVPKEVSHNTESEVILLDDSNGTAEDDAAKVGCNGVAENDVFSLVPKEVSHNTESEVILLDDNNTTTGEDIPPDAVDVVPNTTRRSGKKRKKITSCIRKPKKAVLTFKFYFRVI